MTGPDSSPTPAPRSRYPRVGSMELEEFRTHLTSIAPEVPCDSEILPRDRSPLAAPIDVFDTRLPNRFAIQPMEGWDGTADGHPTPLTTRRWKRFGESGAKLIWGGEAVAVRLEGRANPNQLVIAESTLKSLESLRATLVEAHRDRFGSVDDLLIGLQLTHSGRFSKPNAKDRPEPRAAFRHPVLDARVGLTRDDQVLTDLEIDGLIECFVRAAKWASGLGFAFVDIKHCHGYLLHELLGAHTRPGRYGGSFENRTRALRGIVSGIQSDAKGVKPAARLSAFDLAPFRPDPALSSPGEPGPGILEDLSRATPYRYGFGVREDRPDEPDLTETRQLLRLLEQLGVSLVNLSAGSPYYNPHILRPALYPPSDGYQPPEDPLAGVVRQLRTVRELKREFPRVTFVGSALSYLQDFFPHVAQGLVRDGWMDFIGLGRMVLSYHDLPADVLDHGRLDRKRICRTFSDCTTAPRNGLVSGCYPLDKHYAALVDGARLREIKRAR